MDGPDDDGARRLLPAEARHAPRSGSPTTPRTFPVVEVDATYYALPSRPRRGAWVARTPPDFVFDIKAHALLTGQPTETKRLPKVLREALPATWPPRPASTRRTCRASCSTRSGGCSSTASSRSRPAASWAPCSSSTPSGSSPRPRTATRSARPGSALGEIRLGAVEFRNATWFNDKNRERTLRFLEDDAIPLVMVDGPQGLQAACRRSWR